MPRSKFAKMEMPSRGSEDEFGMGLEDELDELGTEGDPEMGGDDGEGEMTESDLGSYSDDDLRAELESRGFTVSGGDDGEGEMDEDDADEMAGDEDEDEELA